jgi:hypothetical protein
MRPLSLLLPLLASGCFQADAEIRWLERFGFAWTGFNHRVSYLHWELASDGLDMAIIGGASSTSYVPALPDGCDPETCDELPFDDTSTVSFGWGVTSTGLAVGSLDATVIATPAGGAESLEIPLNRRGRGEVAVILQAVTVDTDYGLTGGDDCYVPSLGWHPRRIALSLAEPTLSDDGMTARVTLNGSFEAGLSFEEYRACQDEVIDELQVPITVRAMAIASPDGVERLPVEHQLQYDFSGNQFDPEEQPDPELADRPLSLSWDEAIAGWSALDFHFHGEDPDLRGAYLRSLAVGLSVGEGWASGHATNYSPGTQLSDFSYTFSGEVSALPADGEVSWGQASFDEIEAELDDGARPVIHHEGWK